MYSSIYVNRSSIGLLITSYVRSALPSSNIKLLLRARHRHRLFRTNGESYSLRSCVKVALHRKEGQSSTTFSNILVDVPAEILSQERNTISKDIKNLVVATKAGDASSAVKSVIHRLTDNSKIILLSNGALAVKDELRDVLCQHNQHNRKTVKLILGTLTHGCHQDISTISTIPDVKSYNDRLYNVVHAGRGHMWVEDEEIASLFLCSQELACKYVSSTKLQVLLWEKLAANCVINPLTTILNCNNGALNNYSSEYRDLIDQMLTEVSSIAMLFNDQSVDKECFSFKKMKRFVYQVIADTAQNKSSMLQDFDNRRNTEIKYLNGYITMLGKRFAVDTPINDEIYQKILSITDYRSNDFKF